MPEVCYERLRPAQIVARRTACPVAYLPCGILEWHGRHNPIGLDGVKAHAVCVRLAEALGGLVWPTLWYGDNRADILENVFTNERWQQLTYDHRPVVAQALGLEREAIAAEARRCEPEGWRLWKELLTHTLRQIHSYGFDRIVVLCGHYPLAGPAAEVVAELQQDASFACRVVSFIEAGPIREQGFPGDHAAKWETSTLLALTPELVDLGELADEPEEVLGVLGPDPRQATAEYGEQGIQALIRAVGAML